MKFWGEDTVIMKRPKRPFQAGVIDVGAHSVRLDIFEVSKDGSITLLENLSRSVNLGFDVFRQGLVSPENLSLLSSVMTDFAKKLDEYGITFYRVVATSAIREAFNRELVINRVKNDSKLEMQILESQEEIRITFLSMRETLAQTLKFDELRGLCLVLGSGSLLLSYFEHGLMKFCEEIPIGTYRLVDALGHSSITLEQLIETLESQDIRQRLFESVGITKDTPLSLIAMGASVRTLVGADPADDQMIQMSAGELGKLAQHAMNSDLSKLSAELKLNEGAAVSIKHCGTILAWFRDLFCCSDFICPCTTTRKALIDDLVRRSDDENNLRDPFHTDVIACCYALGRKYGFDAGHAGAVADLCGKILQKLKRGFDFDPRAGVMLEIAALLHDIGRFVDTRQHHKHSFYLIDNMMIPGISQAEKKIIALIARYHRRSAPRESHTEYMSLGAEDKVTVLKLSAILRAADALDCSRHERFRDVKIGLHGHELVFQVEDFGDLRAERAYLKLKGDMFGDVYGLDLKVIEAK